MSAVLKAVRLIKWLKLQFCHQHSLNQLVLMWYNRSICNSSAITHAPWSNSQKVKLADQLKRSQTDNKKTPQVYT